MTNGLKRQDKKRKYGMLKSNLTQHQLIEVIELCKDSNDTVIDQINEIFAVIDINGSIFRGNYALADLLQSDFYKLHDYSLSSLFSSDHWQIMKQNLQKLSDGHKNQNYSSDYGTLKENKLKFHLPIKHSWDQEQIKYTFQWTVSILIHPHSKDHSLFIVGANYIGDFLHAQASLERFKQNLEDQIIDRTNSMKALHSKVNYLTHRQGFTGATEILMQVIGDIITKISVSHNIQKTKLQNQNSINVTNSLSYISAQKNNWKAIADSPEGEGALNEVVNFAQSLCSSPLSIFDLDKKLANSLAQIDLLLKSNKRKGSFVNEIEIIDIKIMIEDVLEIFEQKIKDLNIEVHKFFPENKLNVSFAKNKLMDIFFSLIENAIESLDSAKQRTLNLAIRSDIEHIFISIKDSGVGIHRVDLNKVGTLGYSSKREHFGTSLYLASSALKISGGSLKITSKGLDQGTKIEIELLKYNQ